MGRPVVGEARGVDSAAMWTLLLLGSRLASAEEVEVTLWHAYRGQEREALEGLLRRYDDEHDGIRVVPLAIPYEGFTTKLEAAAPRGNGPDVFVAAHERIGSWSKLGLVEPWSTPPSGLHPVTVEALTFEGQLYGLPLAYKCLALFYNKALVPSPPSTTEALLQLRVQGGYPLAYQATEPYFHAPWMFAFGGGVFREGAVALDQPGNAAAMAFARGLLTAGVIPDEATGTLVTQLFNTGKAATVINGPWFIGEIAGEIDYGVAPIPQVSGAGAASRPFLTVEGVMVSGFSTHKAEAEALARFLAGPEAALTRATQGGQSVATLAVYDNPAVAADPILSAFRAQLDATVPLPNAPEMAATWEPMARALRRVMRGASAPEDAVRQAQHDFAVVSRPPPEPADPTVAAVLVGLLGLGGAVWLGRGVWSARRELLAERAAYLWVAPAALSMALLVVVPFLVGASVSLFEQHDGQWTFVGLSNFWSILSSADWPVFGPQSFYFALAVTILWTLANVVLHVSIGVALALLLREPWLQLRGLYRVLLILPWAIPNYITALLWKGMFHRQFGAINALLGLVGLEPVSWFGQFSTAFAANLVTNTWLGFPFMMVVTLGALQAIPRELEQAAELDGATGWQRFWRVTLPLLKPALLPAVILGSVWTFNMFNIIYLVSAGEPDGSTEILISEAYKWAFTRGHRYGYAAAYAVLIFGVLVIYSRMGNRLAGRKVL